MRDSLVHANWGYNKTYTYTSGRGLHIFAIFHPLKIKSVEYSKNKAQGRNMDWLCLC